MSMLAKTQSKAVVMTFLYEPKKN